MRLLPLLLPFLIVFACAAPTVDKGTWQQMTSEQRVMYVNSLLGAEQVKRSKGGNDRVHPLPAEEYVKRIEAAYARGEQRNPEEIFRDLGRNQ